MAATTSSASILPAGHLRQRDIHLEQHLERWWVQEILKNGLNTCTRNRGIGRRRDRQGHKSPTPPRLHRSLRWITLSKFHILQQWVYHLGLFHHSDLARRFHHRHWEANWYMVSSLVITRALFASFYCPTTRSYYKYIGGSTSKFLMNSVNFAKTQ